MVKPHIEHAFRELDLLDRLRQKLKTVGIRLFAASAGPQDSGTFIDMTERTS